MKKIKGKITDKKIFDYEGQSIETITIKFDKPVRATGEVEIELYETD